MPSPSSSFRFVVHTPLRPLPHSIAHHQRILEFVCTADASARGYTRGHGSGANIARLWPPPPNLLQAGPLCWSNDSFKLIAKLVCSVLVAVGHRFFTNSDPGKALCVCDCDWIKLTVECVLRSECDGKCFNYCGVSKLTSCERTVCLINVNHQVNHPWKWMRTQGEWLVQASHCLSGRD